MYIASPVVLHAKQAMTAADAGKHILIKKPLAMTTEEGQKVVDYCASKGVMIAACLKDGNRVYLAVLNLK